MGKELAQQSGKAISFLDLGGIYREVGEIFHMNVNLQGYTSIY